MDDAAIHFNVWKNWRKGKNDVDFINSRKFNNDNDRHIQDKIKMRIIKEGCMTFHKNAQVMYEEMHIYTSKNTSRTS